MDVTSSCQAARDVVASHGLLISLFERIYFFLQRLKRYTGMSLTKELKELLGKTMAELLSILALSTKSMSERGVSELMLIDFFTFFWLTMR